MRSLVIFCILILANFLAYSQSFQQVATNKGRIGLSLSNVGTVGRPGIISSNSGLPSLEYPIGSGVQHLFEGGLWIGAQVNGQIRVSTASVDAASGYTSGGSGFEFTPLGPITEISSLTNSPNYRSTAISHQDYIIPFTDKNTVIPGTSIAITDHVNPLNASVTLNAYNWNYSFADFFVILNYTITNQSNETWDSVYLGLWTDLVVRNLDVTQESGTGFFNKGGNGYVDSLKALYTYQVKGDDIDYTQSYGSVQYLGAIWRNQFLHPDNAVNLQQQGIPKPDVFYNFWNYKDFSSVDFAAPADDQQRYLKMHNLMPFGVESDPNSIISQLKNASNRTQLLSAGPVVQLKSGESMQFVIAVVCAKQINALQGNSCVDNHETRHELNEHLGWSRRTFLGEDTNANGMLDAGEDLNGNKILDRFILPEPPAIPHVHIVPGNNSIDIYWDNSSLQSIDPISRKQDFEGFKLYRSNPGDDLKRNLLDAANLIAQWDSAGNSVGNNNGFNAITLNQPIYFEGDTTAYRFHYHADQLLNGWQYLYVLTAFDKGDPSLGLDPLESSFTENAFRVWSGTPASDENGIPTTEPEIGVYPNPYKTTAAWDGTTSRTHKIYFYNLPSDCEIVVYTSAGDVVKTITHHAATYDGSDIRWYDNFAGDKNRIMPGGEHAWDLLSDSKTTLNQGVYLFTVKDLKSGKIKSGQIAIIK